MLVCLAPAHQGERGVIAGGLRCLALVVCCGLLAACSGGGTGEGGITTTFRFDPQPPRVGTAEFELRLVNPDATPVVGATVSVEANMNHAGMTPTFAELSEESEGRYVGAVHFTMGGDWFLLLDIKLADGRAVERTLDVPGVRSE